MKRHTRITTLASAATALTLTLTLGAATAEAQFDSGSQGTDPLVITEDTILQLPEDGVLHYTDVTIEAGATLSFLPNRDNTPVWILASGDVLIDGTIDVSGFPSMSSSAYPTLSTIGGLGGPGGFRGGWTTSIGGRCQSGSGPGGGGTGIRPGPTCTGIAGQGASAVNDGPNASSDGVLALACCSSDWLLLGGGSGGGSGEGGGNVDGGGGGGGVLHLACDRTITINGTIRANGGAGGGTGGDGGGGVIRLAADVLSVGATMLLEATSPRAAFGVVQLEIGNFEGESIADKISPPPVLALSPQVGAPPFPGTQRPRLEITSVNNQLPAPGDVPIDVTIPGGSVMVVVDAEYIAVDTEVVVVVRPVGEIEMRFTGNLAGTFEDSSVIVPVDIPAGQRIGSIQAFVNELDVP